MQAAKKLRAGRLYAAQRWYNAQREDVMRMVEWHARLTRNLPASTWYRDKYLEQWADPRVIAALPQIYAAYDAADLQRALFAMMDVFRWVAHETAEHLSYPYRQTSATKITAWAQQYLLE